MIVTEFSKRIFPQTFQGQKMANDLEEKLKRQGCFRGRKEDTLGIVLEAEYRYVIEDEC